jgi:hypothetical protein
MACALAAIVLTAYLARADVFVFPSLSDTFGLMLLEALASGLPVAANPVVGPLDVIGDSGAGVLDANLGRAALAALSIPRELARARALTFSLSASARQFVDNVFAAHGITCASRGAESAAAASLNFDICQRNPSIRRRKVAMAISSNPLSSTSQYLILWLVRR